MLLQEYLELRFEKRIPVVSRPAKGNKSSLKFSLKLLELAEVFGSRGDRLTKILIDVDPKAHVTAFPDQGLEPPVEARKGSAEAQIVISRKMHPADQRGHGFRWKTIDRGLKLLKHLIGNRPAAGVRQIFLHRAHDVEIDELVVGSLEL